MFIFVNKLASIIWSALSPLLLPSCSSAHPTEFSISNRVESRELNTRATGSVYSAFGLLDPVTLQSPSVSASLNNIPDHIFDTNLATELLDIIPQGGTTNGETDLGADGLTKPTGDDQTKSFNATTSLSGYAPRPKSTSPKRSKSTEES